MPKKEPPAVKILTTPCPKCGTSPDGTSTCCGTGGTWFRKCGNVVVPGKKDHTWLEGVAACAAQQANLHEPAPGTALYEVNLSRRTSTVAMSRVPVAPMDDAASCQVYSKPTNLAALIALFFTFAH